MQHPFGGSHEEIVSQYPVVRDVGVLGVCCAGKLVVQLRVSVGQL